MRMIRMITKSRKIMIWICRVIVDTTQVHNNNNISTTTILTSLEESIKMSNSTNNISMSSMSSIFSKTKKCQPDAGDRPDLIQTEPVPSTGLARQQNKNKQNEKMKNMKINYQSHVKFTDSIPLSHSHVSLPVANKLSVESVKHPDNKWITDVLTKTTKVSACCQGHTGNGPHPCGVGVGVPDDGLTRPKNKNKLNEKNKNNKSNYLSHVTLVVEVKHKKQSQVSTKTTKVSACCQGHTGNGPHPCGVGVGVPDGGLARPKSNYLSHVTLAAKVKLTNKFSQSQVINKNN